MKNIQVNPLPARKVIIDLAEMMNVSYSNHGKEYRIAVPSQWGKGVISAVEFDDGFGLMMYDCTFHEEVEIQFLDGQAPPLKFMYCLEGEVGVRFEKREDFFKMEKYHSAIIAGQKGNGHIFRFPRGESIRMRNVEFNRKVFHQRFSYRDRNFKSQLRNIFQNHELKECFYQDGMYSVALNDLFHKVDEYPYEGMTRTVYLEGIALEVLSKQLSLYEEDVNGNGLQGKLREYELSCIDKARSIIENELEDIPTVPEIAHRVGMNVNKLQEGFRIIYNVTVNQYVHTNRLKKATCLLRSSNQNISEIVAKVGLNSKSYFSKIFKDAYGITPTEYRKHKRKEAKEKVGVLS